MDHQHHHHNHQGRRAVRRMASLLAFTVIGLAALIGFGFYQNYVNDPFRDCSAYDSAPDYWQWNCPDGRQFYTQK